MLPTIGLAGVLEPQTACAVYFEHFAGFTFFHEDSALLLKLKYVEMCRSEKRRPKCADDVGLKPSIAGQETSQTHPRNNLPGVDGSVVTQYAYSTAS